MSVEINATNFPDAAWRQYVIDKIDSNHDGVLSDSDIANRESLSCINVNMASIQGISFLTNLKSIDFTECASLTNISDLYNLTKVESIYLKYCASISEINLASFKTTLRTFEYCIHDGDRQNINILNITQCTELRRFHVYNYLSSAEMNSVNPQISYVTINNSKSFDVSTPTLLESLILYAIDVETLNVSGCTHLERLQGEYTNISSIDVSVNTALKVLSLTFTDISSINVSALSVLEELLIDHTSVSIIDVSNNVALKRLILAYTSVSQLDVSNNTQLQSINVNYCTSLTGITGIDECSELTGLSIVNTLLDQSDVDLTKLPKLRSFIAYECYGITKINLGNTPLLLWLYENIQPTYDNDQRGINAFYNANITNIGPCNMSIPRSTQIATDGSSTLEPPLITIQPKNTTVIENMPATFYIKATGKNLVYQWEVSTNGETWIDLRGESSDTYTVTPSLSMNGYKYQCLVTNENGSTYSDSATLSVNEDTRLAVPSILVNPSNASVNDGSNAQFSVVVDGDDLHFQWQTNQNGNWYNISGATDSILSISATSAQNGKQYRCLVSNSAGSVNSNVAYLYVSAPPVIITTPTITNQPLSISKLEAQTATFRVVARGGSLSYQWQIKRGNSWYNISDATNPIYSTRASASLNNTQYRCRVSNSAGTVYSSSATLTVRELGPLPMYGYHSIIISGKNTYGEWEMYPTSRPHVAPPEVKTSYVDVPGADGGLDYTELLNEKPNYGYRKGSWEFLLIPQERWPDVYRSLCNYLHGREHTVVLEDDPNVMYTGRLSVNQWQSAAHNSLITIDYILDPETVNTQDESYNPDELGLEAAERILRRPENLDCVLALVNNQITIVPKDSLYEDGDNITY